MPLLLRSQFSIAQDRMPIVFICGIVKRHYEIKCHKKTTSLYIWINMPYIVPHALHDECPFILNEKETCLKKILKPLGKI